MRRGKRLLATQSPDISTRLSEEGIEPDPTKLDAPPRGSALLVETALTYGRKILTAETIEDVREFARVIVDQLEEVKAKIERQRAAQKGSI